MVAKAIARAAGKVKPKPKPKVNEIERAAMTGGGKTASKLSKDYGTAKKELAKKIRESTGKEKAKFKRQLASLEAKAELEKVMASAKRSGKSKAKVTLPKAPFDFNKGGMPKKSFAKPGSYGKAYMKGGMAKKPKGKK